MGTERGPKRARLLDLAVFGAYAVISVLITWPSAGRAAIAVPGDLIDSSLVVFIVGWQNHALLTDPLGMYQAPLFYPFDKSLLLSEQLLGGSILGLPAWLLTGNPVLSANVMILATFPVAAFGMYLLVRDVTGSRIAGFVSGLAFGYTPYRLSMLWAPHVLLIMWIPYALVHLRRFALEQRLRNAFFFSVFVVLQIASSGHGALIIAAVIPIVALVVVLFRPSLVRRSKVWLGAAVAAVAIGLAVLPFVLPYQQLYEENPEFRREPNEIAKFSAGPLGLITAPANNRLWNEVFDVHRGVEAIWEKWLFPGIAVPALACVGAFIVMFRGPNREGRLWGTVFIVLGVFGLMMSLGTSERLDRPFGFFVRYAPGFDRIRVAGRFSIVTALGMAGLAGVAVSYWGSILKKSGKWTRLSLLPALVVAPLILFEAWPTTFAPTPIPKTPEVYQWLSTQPVSPVLELPTGEPQAGGLLKEGSVKREAKYLLFLTHHWHPILNGYGGNYPDSYALMVYKVYDFPDETSIDFLRSKGVRYVIVHKDTVIGTPWAGIEQEVREKDPQAIVRQYVDEFVLDLRRLN